MYAAITLGTPALDTPHKVAVLVADAPAKAHQQSVLSENMRCLPFCITFIQTVTKQNL
jgi:hypothetical protein